MNQTYHHIGIIGFGARGQQLANMVATQLPAYGKVIAYADHDENLVIPADLYHNCHGLKRYHTYRKLLQDPEIDTVIITTYPETHAEISIAAMDAGKAVLCDKPVAGTLEDAVKLYHYVKTHPCKFAIGLNLPFYPSARKMKELIISGTLGKLFVYQGNVRCRRKFRRKCDHAEIRRSARRFDPRKVDARYRFDSIFCRFLCRKCHRTYGKLSLETAWRSGGIS